MQRVGHFSKFIWWLVVPALVALLGFFVLRYFPHTMSLYAW
ncbi:hypothetical protein PMI29_03315 [Pseudomonas sp. GM49]|nr:hypothetical protein PMI29_03315 [Pseudomonas sp. GM49]